MGMNPILNAIYALLKALHEDGHLTLRVVAYSFKSADSDPYLMMVQYERQNVMYDVTIDWNFKFRVLVTDSKGSKHLPGIKTREEFEQLLESYLKISLKKWSKKQMIKAKIHTRNGKRYLHVVNKVGVITETFNLYGTNSKTILIRFAYRLPVGKYAEGQIVKFINNFFDNNLDSDTLLIAGDRDDKAN